MSQHIRYGRYPHRNALLGRQNTSAETEYMQGKLPKWAKSVIVAVSEPTEQVSAPPRHTGPRMNILVLHSNRQNATSFAKATLSTLEGDFYNLIFLPAPHQYTP